MAATRGFALRLIPLFAVTSFVISRRPFEGAFTAAMAWAAFGACVIGAGLVRPAWLNPLHHLFAATGLWLRRALTQTVLWLLYYAVLTPTAWVARAMGKRFLELETDEEADSYFIRRTPVDPLSVPDAADYEKGF